MSTLQGLMKCSPKKHDLWWWLKCYGNFKNLNMPRCHMTIISRKYNTLTKWQSSYHVIPNTTTVPNSATPTLWDLWLVKGVIKSMLIAPSNPFHIHHTKAYLYIKPPAIPNFTLLLSCIGHGQWSGLSVAAEFGVNRYCCPQNQISIPQSLFINYQSQVHITALFTCLYNGIAWSSMQEIMLSYN